MAKAPKGSFYHHYPAGKEDLAIAVLTWLQGQICQYLDEVAVSSGCAEMIMGLARYSAQDVQSGRVVRGSLMAVLAQEAAPTSSAIHRAVQAYAVAIKSRLEKAGVAEGAGSQPGPFAERGARNRPWR